MFDCDGDRFIVMSLCVDALRLSHHTGWAKQSPKPHQVVGRRMEREDPIDERSTAMMELAQQAAGLPPPEGLLDQLPFSLADRIAGMPCRARVDRTAAAVGLRILRHMGCHAH